ncbi:hypothetical protein C3941_23865 [Kaistia algarum]|uniref:DUF6148 family protein n=1 Tax=Kaistia algarum TaxID=2083279 RepID=UPI000CE90355|nr:DUF6148 family protein [Kaistia algarum]MCX5513430.1 DUF6148 family protein [Kaistia algarum]PPE77436.1 hypothetical protein C3941_23865 [Kaistia algarum]
MASYSLDTARDMLARYIAAEQAILSNQEYQIADRRLKRADLAEVAGQREKWAGIVASLERSASGRSRTRYVVPG